MPVAIGSLASLGEDRVIPIHQIKLRLKEEGIHVGGGGDAMIIKTLERHGLFVFQDKEIRESFACSYEEWKQFGLNLEAKLEEIIVKMIEEKGLKQ